jgi:hypothetical protein
MGIPKTPPPALAVATITVSREVRWEEVEATIEDIWGPIANRTERYDFDNFTSHYAVEMGTGLRKWVVALVQPMEMDELGARKLEANRLEHRWIDSDGNRQVNIDPGYLSPQKLVLASAKPAGHRIYLGDGIWAELTLVYQSGGFEPLQWTYPDFRDEVVIDSLTTWRPIALKIATTMAEE